MDEASAKFELKPNKTAFVYFRFLKGVLGGLIGLIILSVIVFLFLGPLAIFATGIFAFLFIAKSVIDFISFTIQYRKTRYLFFENKIVAKTGGILSERETELVIRNITHVTLIKPFIENKLFKTANILVELAGSANVEGMLISVGRPDELYNGILEIMQVNGFRLKKENLVQKEKPSKLAVVFEVGGMFVGLLFLLLWLGPVFLGIPNIVGGALGLLLFLAALVLAGLGVLFYAAIRFMDLMKRTYYIYDDTIIYNEGFLTKVNSFIPIENLADSEITQTLIDKIFGLYDVRISCQGASTEILFKNMRNGKQMEENIDSLINQSKSLIRRGKEVSTVKGKIVEQKLAPGKSAAVKMDESYTATFKMDFMKTIVGGGGAALLVGLLLAIPTFGFSLLFIVFGVIGAIIMVLANTYCIKPKSMEQRFNFFNSRNVEFSNDKITGVLIKRDFIDNFFNTISIQFWSIGASHNMDFLNIKRTPELTSNVLSKFGMTEQQPIYSADSKFGVFAFLKSMLFAPVLAIAGLFLLAIIFFLIPNLGFFGILLIILAIAILLIFAGIVIYKYAFYKTTKLEIFKNYVHYREGIFFKKFYYATYDNIKDITTVQIPFSSLGSITFNVAGETIVQQGGRGGMQSLMAGGKPQAAGGMLVSHNFKINYVPGIPTKDELIDMIFHKRPSAAQIKTIEANIKESSTDNILVAKPAVANTLLPLIIILIVVNAILVLFLLWIGPVFIIPLLLIDLLILLYSIVSVIVRSYVIQPYRVLEKSGILYKKQTSIVFGKIDHLRSSQGPLNKVFRNGNITVHTTGSSMPEITIKDIPSYREFYQTLEKYY